MSRWRLEIIERSKVATIINGIQTIRITVPFLKLVLSPKKS
jgi:hypothetical protein